MQHISTTNRNVNLAFWETGARGFLSRCSKLNDFGEETIKKAHELLDAYKKDTRPSIFNYQSIAAGALFIACSITYDNSSIDEICNATGHPAPQPVMKAAHAILASRMIEVASGSGDVKASEVESLNKLVELLKRHDESVRRKQMQIS